MKLPKSEVPITAARRGGLEDMGTPLGGDGGGGVALESLEHVGAREGEGLDGVNTIVGLEDDRSRVVVLDEVLDGLVGLAGAFAETAGFAEQAGRFGDEVILDVHA